MSFNETDMANKGTENSSSLASNTDVNQVRQLVQQWRQAYSQLRFEHQRQRDEIVHLGMHERLSEDNEKLLRHENAALKQALAEHAEVAARLKRMRAENETLREDLDDARASVCAGQLEHEARQAELRRQLDAEIRDRSQAQRRLDSEMAARAKLRDELDARVGENALLAAELKECREKLKAKEQEYRCQLIATKLERDEQVARLEGQLQRLQTSGHDACRQHCATLQQELARVRSELAQHLANRPSDPPPAEQPSASAPSSPLKTKTVKDTAVESSQSTATQGRTGTSAKPRGWPENFGELWGKDKDTTPRSYGRFAVFAARSGGARPQTTETFTSPSERRDVNVAQVPGSPHLVSGKNSIRGNIDNKGPVSDGTVDSTHKAQSSHDQVYRENERTAPGTAAATAEKPKAPRTPLKVSDIIKKAAGRRNVKGPVTSALKEHAVLGPVAAADDVHADDVVVSDSDPGEDGDDGKDHSPDGEHQVVMVAATPPTSPKPQQQKKRRLCLEVDDMLFVDA
ncbi:hypothetical protein HPB50_020263 [Hyalomma asiaticum]|uniref:Uncharacterized protein n=1 Tax=Hyalomma asiaticum TaxID=266040 RepID=A0ACB7RNB8_HYAAI|nr:hypothetical protein HPB50_020263 [Hyalomma asiaticum]